MKDIGGAQFGRLTAQWPVGYQVGRKVVWLCSCACGGLTTAAGKDLGYGARISCGCAYRTHGHCTVGGRHKSSSEYMAFQAAKYRCTNPKSPDWSLYGGRGIQFRFASFEQFLDEIGAKPSPKYSLDRINNNGNYEPGNVRWATIDQQFANQRHIHPRGSRLFTASQIAEICSLRGKMLQREVAAKFGTSQPLICLIWNGKMQARDT